MFNNIQVAEYGSNLAGVVFPHSVTGRVLKGAACPVLLTRADWRCDG